MNHQRCNGCGADFPLGEQTCPKCGKPASFAPDQWGIPCSRCGTLITAYTLRCPHCGEGGYPALRARRGKGSKGPPEEDEAP